jgi:protein NrfD
MNSFAADPHWGWWIIWYFYLGGIAAGAYFLATLAELFGSRESRRQTRIGYLIAAPLIGICGLLLIVDLDYPARFWHMLLDHDSGAPHFKLWSPMSIGAWAVLLFSLVSTISFFGELAELGWLGFGRFRSLAIRLHRGTLGRAFDLLGVACGFFIASYTGALLTATNQPIWSDSSWIATLFLASSAGTGLAAIRLLTRLRQSFAVNHTFDSEPHDTRPWHTIERCALGLEIVVAVLWLYSLGIPTLQTLVRHGPVISFLGGAIGLGVLVPIVLEWRPRRLAGLAATIASISILLGGFCLRYAVLTAPNAIRSRYQVERELAVPKTIDAESAKSSSVDQTWKD